MRVSPDHPSESKVLPTLDLPPLRARGRHDPRRRGRGRGGGVGVATGARVTGALALRRLATFFGLLLGRLARLGRCSAGSAATRESDGRDERGHAHLLGARPRARCATDVFSATAAWFGRITAAAENAATKTIAATSGQDGGDRTVGHETPDGQRVRRPLLDRQRSERSGGRPRRITNVVRFPTIAPACHGHSDLDTGAQAALETGHPRQPALARAARPAARRAAAARAAHGDLRDPRRADREDLDVGAAGGQAALHAHDRERPDDPARARGLLQDLAAGRHRRRRPTVSKVGAASGVGRRASGSGRASARASGPGSGRGVGAARTGPLGALDAMLGRTCRRRVARCPGVAPAHVADQVQVLVGVAVVSRRWRCASGSHSPGRSPVPGQRHHSHQRLGAARLRVRPTPRRRRSGYSVEPKNGRAADRRVEVTATGLPAAGPARCRPRRASNATARPAAQYAPTRADKSKPPTASCGPYPCATHGASATRAPENRPIVQVDA